MKGNVFDFVWDVLAAAGWCDRRGGAEYARVRLLWEGQAGTMSVARFVIKHANLAAPPDPGPRRNGEPAREGAVAGGGADDN